MAGGRGKELGRGGEVWSINYVSEIRISVKYISSWDNTNDMVLTIVILFMLIQIIHFCNVTNFIWFWKSSQKFTIGGAENLAEFLGINVLKLFCYMYEFSLRWYQG
jgi:ribose/xylose/arabinose/galactoside ABC-type transport system permease subunit